jgi:hypothetical protein
MAPIITADPTANANIYALGQSVWRYGTSNCFPLGSRPSMAAMYGPNGFGVLGSDVAPTIHDMCVLHNGGSAAYDPTHDLTLQQFIQGGGTGSVPRPEITGRDWQALSFFIRRATTAGSFPGPVALPAPNPPTTYESTPPPQISNVVATRLSFASIQVTWTTDQPTIGLACAGSSAMQAGSYKYSVYSPIESAYGTSHSVVISNCPMSVPTHICVLSKNVAGTSSYSPDQTIGITPDGTAITGGTGIMPTTRPSW